MPGEVPLVVTNVLARDGARAGPQLEHLVDEQERLAVREDLLDLRAPQRQRHAHATSSSSLRSFLRPRCA